MFGNSTVALATRCGWFSVRGVQWKRGQSPACLAGNAPGNSRLLPLLPLSYVLPRTVRIVFILWQILGNDHKRAVAAWFICVMSAMFW